ncbi:hypothetical protein GCM10023235_05930 [Kitasatospora terrestris]|uniref:ANTAR domain-containing protein n=1 Tax=Kitasatospora terrestris TaxID=258051 RepID=A0ABP9D9I9_9ACTN
MHGLALSLVADGTYAAALSATDPVARQVAETQFTLGDGPGLLAAKVAAPVLASDLASMTDARRWPLFAPQAVEAGARAVYSLPLGTSTVVIGTLDLYRAAAGLPRPDELADAVLASDVATSVLTALDHRPSPDDGVAAWLHETGTGEDEVYHATGMIMAATGTGAAEALALLRARAFREGRTAADVARDMIHRRIEPGSE